MSRLQHTQWVGALSQSHPGLCGTPVGAKQGGTLGPLRWKAVGGPTTSHDTCAQQYHKTLTRPRLPSHALVTNMVAEQRDDCMANKTLSDYNLQKEISNVVNTVEVEKPRVITKTDTELSEKRTYHPREDQPGARSHEDPTDSAHRRLMCLLRCSDSFLRLCLCTERVGEGDRTSEFELDLRYSKRAW